MKIEVAARRVGGFSSENKAPVCPNPSVAGIENKGENAPASNAKPLGAVISSSDWSRARWAWLDAVEEDTELPASAKVLASVLARRFADHITGQCFPGNAVLMKAIGGKSEDTVQRGFKALAARGWLRRTEGRGRGNMSSVIFLMPAAVVRQSVRAAVPASAAAEERPARGETAALPPENPPAEKAADMREKPRRNAASRIEPNTNQKKYADADTRRERPCPHLRAVAHHGTDAVADWDSWLVKRGYPTLEAMGILSSDQRGPGYDVLWCRPPSAEDALTTGFARRWADWAVQKAEVRHDH